MMQWLSETFGMRFYYWTGLNWIILFPVYLIGLALIALLWWWLAKRMKRTWAVTVPLLFVLALGPWVEELWIAWNFGQLCKKDAGIFIYRTVEVEGFYDATAHLTTVSTPVPKSAADYYDTAGFKFYELVLADTRGGPSRVVHYMKVDGVWTPTVLDKPTARYHYRWPHADTRMSHKVDKIERTVVDSELNEQLARETKYRRRAPWFFIGLDRPVMLCPAPGEDPLSRYGAVFNLALKPKGGK
jgi:hypothetical protein